MKAKQDREAELRRQLADEEHVSAVQSGPLRDQYIARLRNRIQSAWIKPPSARVGLDCLVQVTQVPGGEVTDAQVTQCNGDAAVAPIDRECRVSRLAAAGSARSGTCSSETLSFRFKPDE